MIRNNINRRGALLITTSAVALLTLGGCTTFGAAIAANAQTMPESTVSRGAGYGNGPGNRQSGRNTAAVAARPAQSAPPLSAADAAGLSYMREEEKLAHDVYQALYAKWSLPVFQNIARSESMHTQSVATLLSRNGLPDPAATLPAGRFSNQNLQSLYDTLVAQGSRSVTDALRVGATIEDLDLSDLATRASAQPDLQRVYDNLAKGSRNHLRAFTSQLAAAGGSYAPQYISAAEFAAIVNGTTERGPNR
jgi:hypothetical protein